MIFDKFFEWMFAPIDFIIVLIPGFDLSIPSGVLAAFGDLFGAIGYIVPWRGLIPIFSMSLLFLSVRFGWAVLLRIKSFIPTLGA